MGIGGGCISEHDTATNGANSSGGGSTRRHHVVDNNHALIRWERFSKIETQFLRCRSPSLLFEAVECLTRCALQAVAHLGGGLPGYHPTQFLCIGGTPCVARHRNKYRITWDVLHHLAGCLAYCPSLALFHRVRCLASSVLTIVSSGIVSNLINSILWA